MKRPFDITFVLTYDNGATSKTVNICCNLDFWMGALFFDASIGAGDAAYIDTSSYIKVYKDLNRFTNAFTNEVEFKKVHAAGETIEWETGEDVSPESLYINSIKED